MIVHSSDFYLFANFNKMSGKEKLIKQREGTVGHSKSICGGTHV